MSGGAYINYKHYSKDEDNGVVATVCISYFGAVDLYKKLRKDYYNCIEELYLGSPSNCEDGGLFSYIFIPKYVLKDMYDNGKYNDMAFKKIIGLSFMPCFTMYNDSSKG